MAIPLTLALVLTSLVGVSAARVLLTLYALELGAAPASVGILGGIFYVFPLLLSFPIGTLADRYGSRALLSIGCVCGTAALLLPFFVRQMPAFYVAAALSGLSLAFNHVTLQNQMGLLSAPNERARNFSNFSLMGALMNFFGPLLAGLSIDHIGHARACLVLAGVSLVPIGLLLAWGRLLPGGNPHAVSAPGATLRTLTDRKVLRMLATSGLVQLGTDLFQFYVPIYGHAKGLSASAIGAALATFAAASFLVRFYLARLVQRFSAERLLAWSFYIGALGFLLVPVSTHAIGLAIVSFIFGLGMGVGTPLSVLLMFSQSSPGRSGQTLGLRLTTNNLVRAVGPMAFGALGSIVGLSPVFWIMALIIASGGILAAPPPAQTGK